MHGKKITLFLMDGTPSGRWTCELSNWTGKVYKIPRAKLKECSSKGELTQAGVYFLLGKDDETGTPRVYIGEAENVFLRTCQHLDSKNFWNEVIIFISKDKNLNKAHVKYLESRFHELAIAAKRYKIENGNVPPQPALSEPEQAELEEFIEHALVLVETLGHRMFEPIVVKSKINQQELFFLKTATANAKGLRTADGFVVLAGAKLNEKIAEKSCPKNILALREECSKEKKCVNFKTTVDILFSSPSSAAAFLTGYSVSGPVIWKNSEGNSLKQFEAEKTQKKKKN